jgi:hypothetical protein
VCRGLESHPRLFTSVLPESQIDTPANNKYNTKQSIGTFVSWLYTGTILATILVNPVYFYIKDKHPELFFSCIPLVQFIFGIAYHSTSHFEEWWNEYPEKNNYSVTENKLLGCIGVICATCLSSVLFMQRESHNWYNVVSFITSAVTVSTFTVEFWFVFYKHLRVITDFSNVFVNTDMNVCVINIAKIKYDLETSINSFKNLLAVTTLLGGLPVGYAILCVKNGKCKPDFPWESVVMFSIYQFILFCIVRYIDNRKGELQRVSKHPSFIRRHAKRVNVDELMLMYNNDVDMVTMNMVEDNVSTMDWQMFSEIAGSEWNQFRVLGAGIGDGEIFQKGILLVSVIVILQNYVHQND